MIVSEDMFSIQNLVLTVFSRNKGAVIIHITLVYKL